MGGLLVRGGVRGAGVGLIEDEVRGIRRVLKDIETPVARLLYRCLMIGAGGGDEGVAGVGDYVDVDEDDVQMK